MRGLRHFRRPGFSGSRDAALLLATTFLLGVGGALTSPAWGSTTPLLVPKEDPDSATALNGVGFNVGRAAGPALGGLVIATLGIAVPFWIFAASNAVIIAALIWWRKPRKAAESLPAERLVSAVRAGVRHAANNPYLGATLIRVLAFFPFASAFMALLPLLALHQISGGPQVYGFVALLCSRKPRRARFADRGSFSARPIWRQQS